ncbi:MAG: chemotaxis protein CheW [Isosphaeraceae bacterium]
MVNELIGMQEVVLKSLEKNYRSIPGLSGASILGDGRVSLILDVDALITMVSH